MIRHALAGHLLKGAVGPRDNDSRFLLDPHRRAIPHIDRMRRFGGDDEVDLCVVGAGAGGSVLAQRLARQGFRVLVLEAGPFWDPDRDWASDESAQHKLYWTSKRLITGTDPVPLGKNNSGHGVGGSMVHYAGYTPRLHPSDFRVRTLDGVADDWPITYWDLKRHYELVELELPVAGQNWPWGDPHPYPFPPHPVSVAALKGWAGALKLNIPMRVGPVGIVNGSFGNRPHCIYRGFCLEGCKVNAKASPLVTHLPDAIAHGVEVRSDSLACRIELDERGWARGVEYVDTQSGQHRFQRAAAVAVCGYSIETPRLLLNSAETRFPHGLCNNEDQVGRYIMVQGAPQTAARFPEEMRMYKAPPPEVSSEHFYETDPQRGFARGFSLQTVSPMPIGWAEHVTAEGHWGRDLREYMRDYNHWTVLAVLSELLPLPDNRVTVVADVCDQWDLPVAQMSYSLGENDRANIAFAKQVLTDIWRESEAQDTLTIDRYAHLVGGCRMGTGPENSVVDADHRSWAVPNLYIADGSVFVTQGSANPALTIMALASRLAERMARGQAMPDARRGSARQRSVVGTRQPAHMRTLPNRV